MPLVLTRKPLQSVIITHVESPETKIVIRLESIESGQARLSFEAPEEYLVNREEIIPSLAT